MKNLRLRLSESLIAEIEAESGERNISKSAVVRELLERAPRKHGRCAASLHAIADLMGSVDGLPADLSARKKDYLRSMHNHQKHSP